MEKKYLISALKPKIEAFLAFKNSLGIEYSSAKHHLRSLDEYNYYNGNSEFLLKEIVEAWAVKKDSKSITQDRSWGFLPFESSENTSGVLERMRIYSMIISKYESIMRKLTL